MAQRDYRAYAQTPSGKAARARAHARYVAKRRARAQPQKTAPDFCALNQAFRIGPTP